MSNNKVCYISGPMTGHVAFNKESFDNAETIAQLAGYVVLNPAKLPLGLSYAQYIDIDMAMVRACDVIVTLPGVLNSKGAQAEIAYAVCLGKKIVNIDTVIKEAGELEKLYEN